MKDGDEVDVNGERRKIAVITGGNGVLGVKIAERLLEGVSPSILTSDLVEAVPLSADHERIRIVLACRSRAKAEVAITNLRKCFPNRTLLLDFEEVDLCRMQNVEDFCRRMLNKGHIIDWLIFNAGIAEVTHLNWFIIAEQFIQDPMLMFTVPRYMIERVGSKTDNGMGLVFQANVFGHYYMLKRLTSLLSESSRVLWSASLETSLASIFDTNDPTGIKTSHSYGSSKRFIELLHCYLTTHDHKPMYFLTHPGITDSGVVSPYQFPIREAIQKLKTISFYFARCCGSPWHAISSYNGSCSMIYCALKATREDEMMKWGSGSDFWGRERLLGTSLNGEAWLFEEECRAVYEIVERLYKEQTFKMGVNESQDTNGKLQQ